MASNINTNVNLNIKSKGGDRAAKDVNSAQSALRKLGQTSQDVDKRVNTLNRTTTRLGQASASSARQFSSQAAGLGGLVGAYAGAAATIFALQQAFSALNRAAQVEQLIKGTNTLAAKVGENGNKIIKSLQDITEGQLTLADASEKANLALSSGFSTKQIEDLGKIATKTSKALGRNLGDAFERLVRGATKLEPELLDELGIFTKLDPSTRKYAQSIGKAVTELSEFERRQAFVNSIIEEGNRKFGDLNTTAPSAQKSLNKLAVTLQNLGAQFGILLSNHLAPVADFFSESLAGAISVFGLVAAQISRTATTQIIGGFDALSNKFDQQRRAFIENAKQTDRAKKALLEFNQTMNATPRVTTVFRGGDAIEGTAKQLFALGQAGKVSASNITEFQTAMNEQARLATVAANKYQAAQDKILSKQAKGGITRGEQRALANYSLLLSNAQRDQLRFAQAAAASNAAVRAQSKTLAIGAQAWKAFGAAVSFASKAMSLAFRAFNVFLLALSIGPLVLELAGRIDILNKAIDKLKEMFTAARNAAKDTAIGFAALSNSLNAGEIVNKYESIGIAAQRSQKLQLQALDDIAATLKARDPFESLVGGEKAAKNTTGAIGAVGGALTALGLAATGIAGTVSAPFLAVGALIGGVVVGIDELAASTLGYEPIIRGALTSVISWFKQAETEVEATNRSIEDLQGVVANLTEEFAKTGNKELLVLIDTYELFIDSVNSATVAQQQFIGSIARLTGQNANLIQDLLGDSFEDGKSVLDGVILGINGVGDSIEQLRGAAGQGLDTFIGFQAVLLKTEQSNNAASTSAKEYINQIQALRTAQSNLSNTIESNNKSIEVTEDVIADLTARLADASEEVRTGLEQRIKELSGELELLQNNTNAMSASFERNKDKVNELSSAYDVLNKQVSRNEAVVKAFDSAARSVSNFDLSGVINPDTGAIAANATEVLANKVAVLRGELTELSNLEAQLVSLQESLASTSDVAAQSQLTEQINTLKKQLVSADTQRDFLNKAIAGTQLSQIQNLTAMNKQMDDLLTKQAQQATIRGMQADIKLLQARESGAQQNFATERRLAELATSTANIQSDITSERLNTQKTLIEGEIANAEAMKEQSRIQSDIRKERIDGIIQQLQYEKDILAITKQAMDSNYNFFDENENKLLKALASLGDIGIDNKMAKAEDALKREEIRLTQEQMAHDQTIIAAKQNLINQEIALLQDEKSARIADINDRRKLLLMQAAEDARRLQEQKALLAVQINLAQTQRAFEQRNQAKANADKANDAKALIQALSNNPEALKAELGEDAFNELQTALSILSSNVEKLNGNLPVTSQGDVSSPSERSATSSQPEAPSIDSTAIVSGLSQIANSAIPTSTSQIVSAVQSAAGAVSATESKQQQAAAQQLKNIDNQIAGQRQISDAINSNSDAQMGLAQQQNKTADAQIANMNLERANIARTGQLEGQLGKARIENTKEAIEQERKKSKLQSLQNLSNTFVDIGGALNALLIDKKAEAVEDATATYNTALDEQKSALEAAEGALNSQIAATMKMKEVMEERRDLELEMARVVGYGVDGASDYFKRQQEYLASIDSTISQGKELGDLNKEKAYADLEAANATDAAARAATNLASATVALKKAKESLLGELASGVTKVGKFTNSVIAMLGAFKGVSSIKGDLGNVLEGGFSSIGDIFKESLGIQTKELNKATYDATETASQNQETYLQKYSGMSSGQARPGELRGDAVLGTLGAAAVGAFSASLVEGGGSFGETVGAAVGGALGKLATPIIGDFLGSALGGLGNFIAPVIGGLIGNFLGGWLSDLFARTKTSVGTVDLGSGGVSQSGEQSEFVGGIASYGYNINKALETITGLETGINSLTAVFSRKGSDIRASYVSAGGELAGFDPNDQIKIQKAVFQVIAKNFAKANMNNKDIRDAVSRLDYTADIQKNLERLEFATKFDDLITNLELTTNNYTDLGSYIEDLTKRLSLSIDNYTQGAISNFETLRAKTADVFGETSTQMARLQDMQVNYLLEYTGLYQNAQGDIELVKDFTKDINNMALVIAQVQAQTMAFKEALVAAGMSAKEAEDALEQGVELKLRKIFDEFEDSLDAALAIGAGIDSDIIPKFEEILLYQKNILADAVVMSDTLAGYGQVVRKTEELVYRQRAEMIAEASYVELIALRNLTSAGEEFSNASVKAATDAEIARRKMETMFEGIIEMADLMLDTTKTLRSRSALRFAGGGYISEDMGESNKDSVPALLMPGEYVVRKSAVEDIGLATLESINSGQVKAQKFALGGSIGTETTAADYALDSQYMANSPTSYIGGDLLNVYTLPVNTLKDFQKFGQDTDLTLSFKEASEIINQANYELFDTYRNLLAATGASGGFNAAMQSVYDALKDGDVILAQARFSMATSLIAATTEQEAYNKVIADSRANQVLNIAGINKAIDGVDVLQDSLNDFYYNAQSSQTTYADLSKITSELNLLLGKEVITSEEYSSALNSVLQAYEDSIAKIQEYTDFFLELQDLDISATGIIQDVREIEYAFLDGTQYILQAVKDGFIDTVQASTAQQRIQTRLNRQRIELLKESSEEELIALKNANAAIVDIVMKTGASAELVARRLDAVAESYGSFESRLVGVFNSTLSNTEKFTKGVITSIESTIKEAGIALDDSTPTVFLGTLATFLQEVRNGSVSLGDLSNALGELNYQLSVSEEIDIETYKTGVSVLSSSFEQFANYAYELHSAFTETQNALKTFGIEIKSQFKELTNSLKSDIEGIVSIYKNNFNDLKGVYQSATDNQKSAEEELYNSLFAAQQAFSSAGGNLDGHINSISDIVKGLDPKYMGYAGVTMFLDDLATQVKTGVASLGNIDTGTPLATLKTQLTNELANLTNLQALPDSADKFVKISRALSKINSLEEQISANTASAGSKLADAALELIAVEKELNKNNQTATQQNVDLELTELTDDLLTRAQKARQEYNKANDVIDGYNAALANSINFTQGLADVTLSANATVAEFTNSLTTLDSQWVTVQTAINDLSDPKLSAALSDIRNQNDQYGISVRDVSADISEAYSNLQDNIKEYLDVEDAYTQWKSLYGTVIDLTDELPIDEFNRLSGELVLLEQALTGVAGNIGGTVTTFGDDLQAFLLNAISILESPIKVTPPSVTGLATAISNAATVASGNLVTTATTGNTYYGTDLTNELLYKILQAILNGGSVSTSSTPAATGSTYAAGSIPNLFDSANLSSLTGQLFSVDDPITRPADFFYIVTPMIVGPEYFFSVNAGETVWTDWFDIKLKWTYWTDWFDIVESNVTWDTFFTITPAVETWFTFFEIDTKETNHFNWFDIETKAATYSTFFTLTSTEITTSQLFSLTGRMNTDFNYWFNTPTLQETNFYEWFAIQNGEVYWYNLFSILKSDLVFWDWFDETSKLKVTSLLSVDPITASDFFYITTQATKYSDWFNNVDKISNDWTYWFDLVKKDISALDFFNLMVLDASELIIPGNRYSGDEFFDIQPSQIYGAEIYSIGEPLLIPGESFVNIDNNRKLSLYVDDIIAPDLLGQRAINLNDVFSNWDKDDGWDIKNKASLAAWDLFDKDYFDSVGLAGKMTLKTSDIFTNIKAPDIQEDPDSIGEDPKLDFENKIQLQVADLFLPPNPRETGFQEWFTWEPRDTSFYEWFTVKTQDKVPLLDLVEPAGVEEIIKLINEPMMVRPSELFYLTAKPEFKTAVTAQQLYTLEATDLDFNEVFNLVPFELEAHRFIDFNHLYENKYVAQASDVLDILPSTIAGISFWIINPTSIGGVPFSMLNNRRQTVECFMKLQSLEVLRVTNFSFPNLPLYQALLSFLLV